MKFCKGQVSMEYLMLIGFVTLGVMILLIASQYYTRATDQNVRSNQAYSLVREIVDSAETVYYRGEPSKTLIKANMPDGVEEIIIGNGSVTFRMESVGDISRGTAVNISGTLPTSSGLKYISIESKGGYVNVSIQ